jgi:Inner membrane component domain
MRTLLNVIWLVLCGIWLAIGYMLAGVVCCVLIVTIPFGLVAAPPRRRTTRRVPSAQLPDHEPPHPMRMRPTA